MQQLEIFEQTRAERSNAVNDGRSAPSKPRAKRADAPAHEPAAAAGFALTDHACRKCGGGRLLSRPSTVLPGALEFICSNCEVSAHSQDAGALCFCGFRVPRHGPKGGYIDPGVRCHRNPAPTPDFPSVVVASERPPEAGK